MVNIITHSFGFVGKYNTWENVKHSRQSSAGFFRYIIIFSGVVVGKVGRAGSRLQVCSSPSFQKLVTVL